MQEVPYKSLIFFILLIQFGSTISSVVLQTSTQSITIFQGNSYASAFIYNDKQLQCSISNLYTYKQTPNQLINNSPYQISLNGVTSNTKLSLSTTYQIFKPSLSSTQCIGSSSSCSISIKNNCPNPVGYFSYFDILNLNVEGLQTISFYVICNNQFSDSTFEAGLLLLLFIFIAVIILGSIYSKAWSYSGEGYNIDFRIIIPFNIILTIGGIISLVAPVALPYLGDIFSWILGTLGVMVIFNQLLFLFKISKLSKGLITIKLITIRIIDCISFSIGLAFSFAWYFSNKNWIISDIISICLILAVIKLLKFTNLKIAIIQYFTTLSIQIIFLALIETIFKTNYSSFLINNFNNPFQLQLPTINPVYGQKCSWISVSVIMYPGILISFFRRFDTSRNTNIYTITSICLLFGGSIIWMILNVIITRINLPYGIIAEPAMIGLVCLFAYNRKQIRILWDGKFYDAQFMNKEEVQLVQMSSSQQRKSTQIKEALFDGLKINQNQDSCIQPIFPEDKNTAMDKKDQI